MGDKSKKDKDKHQKQKDIRANEAAKEKLKRQENASVRRPVKE
jgi:hypothetical protein